MANSGYSPLADGEFRGRKRARPARVCPSIIYQLQYGVSCFRGIWIAIVARSLKHGAKCVKRVVLISRRATWLASTVHVCFETRTVWFPRVVRFHVGSEKSPEFRESASPFSRVVIGEIRMTRVAVNSPPSPPGPPSPRRRVALSRMSGGINRELKWRTCVSRHENCVNGDSDSILTVNLSRRDTR